VLLRYHDVRPQLHVASYDLPTGQLLWRRMICAGEGLARGQIDELSHLLLTLAERSLYLGTNTGAVAAICADTGRIRWISQYPRAENLPNGRQIFRDLSPPVYHRGTVYFAPQDSPAIWAFDAASGSLRWSCKHADDAIHLLGVADGNLIASGKKLWWIDARTGRVNAEFPDTDSRNAAAGTGFGRGIIAGDKIYWPRREDLAICYVRLRLDQPGFTLQAEPPKPWQTLGGGLGGGYLSAQGKYVVLAGSAHLWCWGPAKPALPPAEKGRIAPLDQSALFPVPAPKSSQ
jgi:outer membrane protein assembly factor BamB